MDLIPKLGSLLFRQSFIKSLLDNYYMKQINFRVNNEIYEILQMLASQLNISIPNLSKKIIMDKLSEIRIKIALKGYKKKRLD